MFSEWGHEIISGPTYGGLFAFSILYALVLWRIRSIYDPRWLWLVVLIGVVLVGVFGWWRLRFLPLPNNDARNLVVWVWRITVYHFITAAIPIIGWQFLEDRGNTKRALKYREGEA